MNHVMLDLETLGTRPGYAVATIGAVKFDPERSDKMGESLYVRVSLEACLNAGLKIDAATLKWWLVQSDKARAELASEDTVLLSRALELFSGFFVGSTFLWSHGANFDVPVLEAAYKAGRKNIPWQFWTVRDTRTLFDLAGGIKVEKLGVVHNALQDSINQAAAVIKAYRILGKAKY